MSSHHNFRAGQQNKLVSEPPIAGSDEHLQLVEADQRFRARAMTPDRRGDRAVPRLLAAYGSFSRRDL
jgi:hypothetical protein